MDKGGLRGLSKLSHSIVQKTVEIERLDLLYDMRDFLSIIATVLKPYDYFETLRVSVKEAHDKMKREFVTTIYKILILPVPVPFTIWVNDSMSADNMYEILQGEGVEIERVCRKIYISNDANPTIDEVVRIHVFGRWEV
jgi:hypothetical protein